MGLYDVDPDVLEEIQQEWKGISAGDDCDYLSMTHRIGKLIERMEGLGFDMATYVPYYVIDPKLTAQGFGQVYARHAAMAVLDDFHKAQTIRHEGTVGENERARYYKMRSLIDYSLPRLESVCTSYGRPELGEVKDFQLDAIFKLAAGGSLEREKCVAANEYAKVLFQYASRYSSDYAAYPDKYSTEPAIRKAKEALDAISAAKEFYEPATVKAFGPGDIEFSREAVQAILDRFEKPAPGRPNTLTL